MIITTEKSKWPTISVGICWILYSLLFPFYRMRDYLICAFVSALIYFVLDKLLTKRVDLTGQIEKTGVSAMDKQMTDNLRLLYIMEEKVTDLPIEEKVNTIIAIATSIYEYVTENPQQMGQINTFTSYYIPTLDSLIDAYIDFDKKETPTSSMKETQEKITDSLDVVASAFSTLLEQLYQNKVIDVKTDVIAFERMLASEGLTDEGLKQKMEIPPSETLDVTTQESKAEEITPQEINVEKTKIKETKAGDDNE